MIPTIHEGYAAREMEKRGKLAERCEINREIAAANRDIKAILAEPEPDHRTKIERQVDELLNGFEKLNKKLKEQKKILAAQSFSTPDQRAATEKIMPFGSEKTENATEWSHEQETEEAPDPELEAQERARKKKKTEKKKKRGLRL